MKGSATTYYESLVGAWRGELRFSSRRERPLGEAPLIVRVLSVAGGAVGAITMGTTLERSDDDFVHTTTMTKLGITMIETEERIVIGSDGRSFRMSGVQRMRLGAEQPYDAEGEIDEDAKHATYRVPWAGISMVQRTAIVEEGLELAQETAWTRATVLLRRRET